MEKKQKFDEIIARVIMKAWEDEDFKNELIVSPKSTIESFTGEDFNLKEDVEIIVADQTIGNKFYLNIPVKPNLEDIELSEEQMDIVAGGADWTGTWEILAETWNPFKAGVHLGKSMAE